MDKNIEAAALDAYDQKVREGARQRIEADLKIAHQVVEKIKPNFEGFSDQIEIKVDVYRQPEVYVEINGHEFYPSIAFDGALVNKFTVHSGPVRGLTTFGRYLKNLQDRPIPTEPCSIIHEGSRVHLIVLGLLVAGAVMAIAYSVAMSLVLH